MRSLLSLKVTNFRSLAKVAVELSDLNVLVGPNGAGKSNLLQAIQFLGDTARLDLFPAIKEHGGFENIFFRGGGASGSARSSAIRLEVAANVTKYASEKAPDEYSLSFWKHPISSNQAFLRRHESFQFKRTQGRGRRIQINGANVEFMDEKSKPQKAKIDISATSAALSTLRRLGESMSATQVDELAQLFETFRVYEPRVAQARLPSPVVEDAHLNSDASNLSAFLYWLNQRHEDVFDQIVEDMNYISPSIRKIEFHSVGGGEPAVSVKMIEAGLKGSTDLANASFGTVRALALLAMLHDPTPPRLTCVEEIDHGLHPHALDRIVDRLRQAKARTQLIIATHSPALVNRLDSSELIVCERDNKSGASLIPAISAEEVSEMTDASQLRLGELWFSGVLGGGL